MTPSEDNLPDSGTGEETENEVLRTARELQAQKAAADATEAADAAVETKDGKRKRGWKTAAAAAGLGSAAVLAALLYANRDKK